MKKGIFFFFIVSLLFAVFFLRGKIFFTRISGKQPSSISLKQNLSNIVIEDFEEAKKIAAVIYESDPYTFYCGCKFSGNAVDHRSCGYTPQKESERAYRIEWEHIVPAHAFGQSFSEWREGDSRCVHRKSGKLFKGRSCARLVVPAFRRMEADLYNLVPAIGEVNQLRSNYSMGMLSSDIPYQFGKCRTRIAHRVIEPREEVRGFIARTYKYMEDRYPGHGIISRKNEKLFEAWDRMHPADLKEKLRAQKIAKIQGNSNRFVPPL